MEQNELLSHIEVSKEDVILYFGSVDEFKYAMHDLRVTLRNVAEEYFADAKEGQDRTLPGLLYLLAIEQEKPVGNPKLICLQIPMDKELMENKSNLSRHLASILTAILGEIPGDKTIEFEDGETPPAGLRFIGTMMFHEAWMVKMKNEPGVDPRELLKSAVSQHPAKVEGIIFVTDTLFGSGLTTYTIDKNIDGKKVVSEEPDLDVFKMTEEEGFGEQGGNLSNAFKNAVNTIKSSIELLDVLK